MDSHSDIERLGGWRLPLIGVLAGGSGVAALAIGGSSALAVTLSFALPLLIGGALTLLCIRGTRPAVRLERQHAEDEPKLADAPEAGRRLATQAGRETVIARGSDALSARERDILLLMAEGLSARQIAAELSVPMLAVSQHLRRIRRKLAAEPTVQRSSGPRRST